MRFGQSNSWQRGLGLSLWGEGGRKEIKIGVWSDPVEGRVDESQESKAKKSIRVGKHQVDGTLPVSSHKGKPGVDDWGVEEGVAQLCCSVEI